MSRITGTKMAGDGDLWRSAFQHSCWLNGHDESHACAQASVSPRPREPCMKVQGHVGHMSPVHEGSGSREVSGIKHLAGRCPKNGGEPEPLPPAPRTVPKA